MAGEGGATPGGTPRLSVPRLPSMLSLTALNRGSHFVQGLEINPTDQVQALVKTESQFHADVVKGFPVEFYGEQPGHGFLGELLAEIFRQCSGDAGRKCPPWLEKARQMAHDRFTERLTLAEIARAVGVHPVHLAREFSRHYRCTVGELIRELRIEYACREISHEGRSLADIALAAGFSDQSNFSRTFKKVTGFTPHRYQRMVCQG